MENLVVDPAFWRNKRVLITGHSGFKGGWLALWLQSMQAEVYGLSLPPTTQPNLFEVAKVAKQMHSMLVDITDLVSLRHCFQQAKPEIVIHLAAQALVRYGYQQPLETYKINVLGTLHLLECIRECDSVKAAVLVTTDKCYENREWTWPYRENDALGGYDPYSSSKACMEILIASYRQSFFSDKNQTAIATARAGNVIGGGDWSPDRLVPDVIKAAYSKQSIRVRNPQAIRPWQHVLEPLAGYLRLAQQLYLSGQEYAEAWNFGPEPEAAKNVGWLIGQVAEIWPGLQWETDSQAQPHEAHTLKLDCSKAHARLDWHERWSLPIALRKTVAWYQQQIQGADMQQLCLDQITEYTQYRTLS